MKKIFFIWSLAFLTNSGIFAMRNTSQNEYNNFRFFQRIGRRATESVASNLLLSSGVLRSDLPYFLLYNVFKMRNTKNTKPTHEQLVAIAEQIQCLHPQIRCVRVKRFYDYRIKTKARIGNRILSIKGSTSTIIDNVSRRLDELLAQSYTEVLIFNS